MHGRSGLATSSAAGGWLERCRLLGNRLLANPRFRNWAAAFPPTRAIARRRARQLFDLCAGFVYSQILLACVRLRIFEILAAGPQTAAALSPQLGLSEDAAARLLDAAVSLRLLARFGGQAYGLGALGAPLVGNAAITSMVEHHALLYADLRDPVDLLRNGPAGNDLSHYWAYAGRPAAAPPDDSRCAAYSALMSASQSLIAAEVLAACPFKGHACLLDVGGGEGTFLAAAAAHFPHLGLMLFDLPPVAARARAQFARLGLADRAAAFGGSFFQDPLPAGADIASLVRVIHDHDDDAALQILRAVRRALPAHGVVVVAEPMSGTRGAEPVGDAYFGFYLLAMGSGRPRTPERLASLLLAAGFESPHLLATRMPLQTRVMVARVGPSPGPEKNI
jgi:demethylspheroidene O-methyltransferase